MGLDLSFFEPFETLAEDVKARYAGQRLYYLANQGNWGDALIRAGTRRFFDTHRIGVVELGHRSPLSWLRPRLVCGFLLYGGGGAWCRVFGKGPRYVGRRLAAFKGAMVLPSTFEQAYAFPQTVFWARDRFESRQAMPGARFCHDLAFFLLGGFPSVPPGRGRGNFFRGDNGRAGCFEIPADNCDISAAGRHHTPIGRFCDVIARYEEIHTDRLHVAIAACMMGKRLHLYAGAYFKNRALFRSSIEPFFEKAVFHEAHSRFIDR